MPDKPITKFEPDKLPGVVEAQGYRKTSDDFTFTIATARKYEEQAKAFMRHLSSLGVFFFVPCKPDEVEGLLRQKTDAAPARALPGPQQDALRTVTVDVLATALGMTERNVQLLEQKGVLVRAATGQYDLLASCGSLWKALKEQERGTGDEQRNEKTLILQAKRERLQLDNLERAGKLVNSERMQEAYENVESEERHAIINMPKKYGPQCDMLPGVEVEVKLNEWVHEHLSTFSSFDKVLAMARGQRWQGAPARETGKPPGKAKKAARKRPKEERGKRGK